MDFAISRPFHRHRAAILALLIAIYLLIPSISLAQSTSACLSNPVCASSILGASGGTVGSSGGGVGGAVAVGVAASLAAGSVVQLYNSGDLQSMWDSASQAFCTQFPSMCSGAGQSAGAYYSFVTRSKPASSTVWGAWSGLRYAYGPLDIYPHQTTLFGAPYIVHAVGASDSQGTRPGFISSDASIRDFELGSITRLSPGSDPFQPAAGTSAASLGAALAAGISAGTIAVPAGTSATIPQAGRKLGFPVVLPDGTIIPAGTTVPAAVGAGTQFPTNTGDPALNAANAAANTAANTAATADAAAAAANAAAEAARAAEDMAEGISGNIPQAQSIEPSAFSKPNFLSYGLTVFSAKFPLDIIGTLPSIGESASCPTFTFFDESFELCFIKDAVVALKIPAIISFVIWAILAL